MRFWRLCLARRIITSQQTESPPVYDDLDGSNLSSGCADVVTAARSKTVTFNGTKCIEVEREWLRSAPFQFKLKAAAEQCNYVLFERRDAMTGLAKRYANAIAVARDRAASSLNRGDAQLAYAYILICHQYQKQYTSLFRTCSEAFAGYSEDIEEYTRSSALHELPVTVSSTGRLIAKAHRMAVAALACAPRQIPSVFAGGGLMEAPESVCYLKYLIVNEECSRIRDCVLVGRSSGEKDLLMIGILYKFIASSQESGDRQLVQAFEIAVEDRRRTMASRENEGD